MYSPASLLIKDISFERQFRYLFQNLNFKLNSSELLQIHGANGTGKTTLLRMIAGLIIPEDGNIFWQNIPIKNNSLYQENLDFIGHKSIARPYLSVKENLQVTHFFSGKKKSEINIESACERVGLISSLDQLAYQLSAGQMRRMMMARLILNAKPLWILDEPFTALDMNSQTLFYTLIKEHLSKKGMIIIVTHQKFVGVENQKNIYLGEDIDRSF